MKKFLGCVFAVLIAVFAVMPNVYAEAQKDYGNLDMNRWVYFGRDNDNTTHLLIDVTSLNYYDSQDNNLLCNLWVCYFKVKTGKYNLQNLTINYDKKTYAMESYVSYKKNDDIESSRTIENPKFSRIVPNSFGETIYDVAFPYELMEKLKEEAIKNQ